MSELNSNEFIYEDNIDKYLDLLIKNKNNFLVVITVKDTAGDNMSDSVKEKIKMLGLESFVNDLWVMYIGVIDHGKVVCDQRGIKPENPVCFETILNDGTKIIAKSESYRKGNSCKIKINDEDYEENRRGINIVIYDTRSKRAVDSIVFDCHGNIEIFKRAYLKLRIKDYVLKSSVDYILSRLIIKITIVYWGGAYFWNVFDSFIKEIKSEPNVDLKIVSVFKDQKVMTIAEEHGVTCVYKDEYQIEMDSPDIIIFSANNDLWRYSTDFIRKMRANVKLLICLPVALILNAYDSIESLYINMIERCRETNVDYIVMDRFMYSICEENNILNDSIVEIGNPKFDAIYTKLSVTKEIPDDWEKLKGKKVFLWLGDHDWETGTNVSFDLYARSIFEYFGSNNNASLIFRPHPVFIRDTKSLGIWSEKDVSKLEEYIRKSDNIVWDKTSDYSLAYQCADAMMTEVGSGTIASALSTKKPIAVLYRNDCKICNNNRPITDIYYSCYSEDDVVNFMDNICNDIDPLKEARVAACDKYISHFDGQNGKRLKDFIFEKYNEKIRDSGNTINWKG